MAARVRIELNRAGIRQLLFDPRVRADLARRMRPVLSAAIANAPVESGAYRDSIRTESASTDRAVERVVADSDHALVVEAHTGNLARALDAAGGG